MTDRILEWIDLDKWRINFIDNSYASFVDLCDGVKNGELLIHCKSMRGQEMNEIIFPDMDENLDEGEFIVASNNLANIINGCDEVYFIPKGCFKRVLGGNQIQLWNGEVCIYIGEIPTISEGEWFDDKETKAVAIMSLQSEVLQEHKSISAEVIEITKHVIDLIVSDSVKGRMLYSERTRQPFKEDEVECDLSRFGINNIDVYYLIYFYKDKKDARETFNCSYDEKTRRMEIITYVCNGYFAEDFEESVMHEVTHMFQYGKGMKKRESLYDKCVELYNNKNQLLSKLGLLLYHTFPHEQDAFTHQFFQRLNDLKIEVNHRTDFDALVRTYSRYGTLCKYKKEVIDNLSNPIMIEAIKDLGFDKISVKKRILFAFSRFRKKLLNACEEYAIRTRKLNVESRMTEQFKNLNMLAEQGYKLEDYDKVFKMPKILIP